MKRDPFMICAPDSFKETISAIEAARAMADGVKAAGVRAVLCPIADGGEGSLEALAAALHAEIRTAHVTGPLGSPVRASYSVSGQLGIVELAQASGLTRIPKNCRDPTRTTTYGTGELIRLAHQAGCDTVIVMLGGSGTVDGGAGLAQALGAKFVDHAGKLITQPITGGMLPSIAHVQPPADLPTIRVACDVTNPLWGKRGAAAVYGPQKGASPEQVKQLDAALAHLATITGTDGAAPGLGAAGGAALALVALCKGRLERGIDLILDAINFDKRCEGAELVLTGEGRLDDQSLDGKATIGVAARAAKLGVATIAIVGSTGENAQQCIGPISHGLLRDTISLTERYGYEPAKRQPARLITETAEEIARQWMHGTFK